MNYLKRLPFFGRSRMVLCLLTILLASCDEENVAGELVTVVEPGQELPIGETIRIVSSGSFTVPSNAVTITTICYGQVSVAIGSSLNSCDGSGNSNQTNALNGITEVSYELNSESYAEVIVR